MGYFLLAFDGSDGGRRGYLGLKLPQDIFLNLLVQGIGYGHLSICDDVHAGLDHRAIVRFVSGSFSGALAGWRFFVPALVDFELAL
jgi:hypothetical protein